jgi:hypothetical protein
MLGIDPNIVEHEIKTYLDARPARQRLRAVNPREAPAIKAEVEKYIECWFHLPSLLDRMGVQPRSHE